MRRSGPRSSNDGKPVVRIRDSALRLLCEKEHGELWRRYLADGSTPSLEDILAAEDADDGLSSGPSRIDDLLDDHIQPEVFVEDDEPTLAPRDATETEEEREPRLRRLPGRQRGRRRQTSQAPDD